MSYSEPNYTQVPNTLLDEHAPKMSEAELRISLAIVRQTFGWHRRQKKLSLTELSIMTGLSRQGTINGIEDGIARGTITRVKDGQGYLYELTVMPNKLVNQVDQNESASQPSRPVGKKASQPSRPAVVNQVDQLPPTLKKDLNKVTTKEKRVRVSSTRARVESSTETDALHARAIAHADSESFDGPSPNGSSKAKTPPRLSRRRMQQRKGPHFDPGKVVEGFVPGGEGDNPVEVYFERFSPYEHKLSAPLQDDLIKAATDLDRWRAVVVAWDQANHKPGNTGGMLDWYRDPSRLPSNRHRPHQNGVTPQSATVPPLIDMKFKDWLFRTYRSNLLPSVMQSTRKSEKELRDEYKQWRAANQLPPG